jgi:hypothetical protein
MTSMCTDPNNCRRCSEDADVPHAGISHADTPRHAVINEATGCYAYQASDQMVCKVCGVTWDVNGLDRPPCETTLFGGISRLNETAAALGRAIITECPPPTWFRKFMTKLGF